MESRFNIPAPAVVKFGSDISAEMGRRLKVAVGRKSADVEASAKADPLKLVPRKASGCSHGCPYRNPTQVGE